MLVRGCMYVYTYTHCTHLLKLSCEYNNGNREN